MVKKENYMHRAVPTLNEGRYNRSVPNFVKLEWSSSSGAVCI